jgi:hypothetical protein
VTTVERSQTDRQTDRQGERESKQNFYFHPSPSHFVPSSGISEEKTFVFVFFLLEETAAI